MKLADKIEFSWTNLKKHLSSSKNTMIILGIVIIVFNLTYSMTEGLKNSSNQNIANNTNLKIIEVLSIDDLIEPSVLGEISELDGVNSALYNYLVSCSVEFKDSGFSVQALGIEQGEVTAFTNNLNELKSNEVILNEEYQSKGIKQGDLIDISYNSKVGESQGVRNSIPVTVAGFYTQPVINSWSDDIVIMTKEMQNIIASQLYGLEVEELIKMNIGQERAIVFVDNVDNVSVVAEEIETFRLGTAFALNASGELPAFAKAIIVIGGLIVLILLGMSIIIIDSTINNSIKKRLKEIGLLKTIGFSEKNITHILFLEILEMWVIVVIVSTISSVALILGANIIKNSSRLQIEDLNLSLVQMGVGALLTLTTMALATVRIIRKISKINIVDVISRF